MRNHESEGNISSDCFIKETNCFSPAVWPTQWHWAGKILFAQVCTYSCCIHMGNPQYSIFRCLESVTGRKRERKKRKKKTLYLKATLSILKSVTYEIKTKSFCCVSRRLSNGQQSEVQFSIAYVLQR